MIFTIAKKEFKAYFLSPIAYVYLVTFLVVSLWLFFRPFFVVGQANMRGFFMLMPWIYLFFVPAVSMSKWSEEKKLGTMELLLTLPVKDSQVVVGKFMASLALISTALLLTLPLPISISFIGDLDTGPIIGGYVGLLLMGAAYLSIGLFISALTENQIIAFILGVVACFIFLLFGEPMFTNSLPGFFVGMFQYMGLGTHFVSIARGVLDSRDIIFYLSMIGFFLWLNLNAIEARSWKRKKERIATILSVVIVLVVVNFLGSRHFFRVDLTESNQYTLSDSTEKILKGLDDVVNIRLYFSKDLPPALFTLKREVDDMLSEYRTYAGGKLKVEYINPQESPQKEAKVRMLGIPPVQLNVIAKDKQELVKIYLGMAVVHNDETEIIPVVQGTSNLEYDLTSAILKVSTKEMPAIKWLVGRNAASYEHIKGALKRRYTLEDVKAREIKLDAATDALLVIPLDQDLSDAEISQIEEYIEAGGKIFMMLDRISIESNLKSTPLELPNVLGWLKKKKVEVQDKLIVDRVNTHAAFSGGYVTYHVPYPYWVKVTRDGFNPDSPVVSDLDSLILPWASPIKVLDQAAYTVLAESSPFNKLVDLTASLMPENTKGIIMVSQAGPEPLVVLSSKGDLLLVGNSKFIQDNFLKQFVPNSIFFENAIDFMAMGNQLIGIRSKGVTDRPLDGLTAGTIAFVKYFNLLITPFVLVMIGLAILFLRKHKKEALELRYKK